MTTKLCPSRRLSMRLMVALSLLPAACDSDSAGPGPDDQGPAGGKADAAAVEDALADLTADGELSADDVRQLFAETGNRVGESEMAAIEAALTDDNLMANMGYTLAPDAFDTGLNLALRSNLFDYEVEAIDEATSFGGNEVPEEVQKALARARLAGAVAYDIRELDNDCDPTLLVPDETDPSEMVPQDCGEWAHYPAGSAPVANMTFAHTEVTPKKLAEDPANGGNGRIGATGSPGEGSVFQKIAGQTWANNCAILSDGSFHCLPSHRGGFGVGLWLTNPALSRCPAQQFSATTDANGDVDVTVDVEFFRMFVDFFVGNGLGSNLLPDQFHNAIDVLNDQLAREHRDADAAADAAAADARAEAEADGVTDPAELDAIAEEAAEAARAESLAEGVNTQLGGLDHIPEQPGVDYTEACKHILWHGHVNASNGRITHIGTSGRPAKRVGEGRDVLVDPAPILRAWGFQVDTETRSEHSTVRHASDPERNVLVEP